MAKRLYLTEDYVAYCAHGGVVKPKGTSSTPSRVVAGVPIVNIQDLPGTPISGCPQKNPCTAIANLTSGSAEMNIKTTNVNPALDLVGIKSNKGAAISLSFSGQTVAGAFSIDEEENHIEEDGPTPKDIKEEQERKEKEKEKYNLYILRESKDNFLQKVYKPLRPSRKFNKIEEYYAFDIKSPDSSISDKIITQTLAFVYIKLASGKINEYKINNAGSILGERLKDIRYKDENNIEHKYIPLYDENPIEIFYTNVQLRDSQALRKKDLSNFKATPFNPSKPIKNDFYIKDLDNINMNEIEQKLLDLQKKYDPIKSNRPYPFDVIVNIQDPIAKIEDMYNSFEFKFKNNYSYNNKHINEIKKKNAYVYSVANQMDYLYVSKEEQQIYDTHIKKLQDLYKKLVNGVLKGSLASLIIKDLDQIEPLDKIINPNYDLAVNYFNEVTGVNKPFFKDLELDNCDKKHFEMYHNFITCKYYGLIDYAYVNNENESKKRRLQQKDKSLLDKIVKLTSDIDYMYLVLSNAHDKKYHPYREKPQEILALLIFSIYFSNKYKKEVEKEGLSETVEDFYFALKNSPKLPSITNQSIKEIRDIVKYQKDSYAPILSGENKLLEQYKDLDTLNKKYSYDIKEANKTPKEELNDLYVGEHYKSFVYEDEKITAKKMHESLLKAINQSEVKEQIKAHLNITQFDNKEKELNYLNTMINLSYFFIANRTKTDLEANQNSPFGKNKDHIYELINNITKRRLKLEENFARKVDELPVIEYYSQALVSHIVHSLVQTNKNKEGFNLREENIQRLFESLEKVNPKKNNPSYKIDITNTLDANFERELKSKSKIEELTHNITTAIGINSKIMDLEVETKKVVDEFDGIDERVQPKDKLKLPKLYKKYILLSKSASSFITIINLGSFVIGKKALKNEDIFPLMESTGKLLGFMSNSMPKTKSTILKQTQKILTASNLEQIKKFDVLAKVGMVTIIVSTFYELEKLDDTDIDGQVAVLMKNTLELSLLIIPLCVSIPGFGWAAAAIVLGIDLAWRFYIKDIFVDSPIETYILKSLLYKHKEQTNKFEFLKVVNPGGYALYSNISSFFDDGINYNTLLLKEVANKDKKLIKGFQSFNEIQTFIGENYDKYNKEFNEALKYELTNLKIALNDYKVEIEDTVVTTVENIKENLYLKTQIKIPKETLENNIEVVLKSANYTRVINRSKILQNNQMPEETTDFYYDTVVGSNLRGFLNPNINKKHFEDTYLYIVNRDLTLKYKIEYKVKFEQKKISYHTGMTTQKEKIVVKIEDIELTPLLKGDETLMDSIIKRRKFDEGLK